MNASPHSRHRSHSTRPQRLVALAGAIACLLVITLCAGCSAAPSESTGSHGNPFANTINDASSEHGSTDGDSQTESAPGEDPLTVRANEIIDGMTLEQKAAQLFVVTPEAITGVDTATLATEATRAALEAYPVGGIVYFQKNLVNEQQTRDMLANTQAYAREVTGLPAFLCVDEEGGTVSRIGGNPGFAVTNVGDMCDVGALGDTDYARNIAANIGSYLRDLGFNVDFAPDADIANNPASDTMALRSFGSSAAAVSPMVKAQVEGFLSSDMLCAAKHFPGIGGAEGDSHDTSIYSSKTVDEMAQEELLPFQAAMDADVPFIMVGHLSTPQATGNDLPASVSSAIVTDLLRGRLGYDGIVITDSLAMGAVNERYAPSEAAVAALEAGVDMVLMPADLTSAYQGVLDAVASGRLSEERIDDSLERIVRTKLAWEDGSLGA